MLIRMRADKVILSFLLLAGVGSCIAEEDGYVYSKPSVSFSDGYKNVGAASQGVSQTVYQQPQYVAASTTVKPATNFGGFNQIGQQQKQTLTSGFQGFGQQSGGQLSGFGVTGQKYGQQQVTITPKPQTVGFQGIGQLSGLSGFGQGGQKQVTVISKPTGFQGFGQQSAGLTGQLSGFGQAGQYQGATVKPQTSYGQAQTGQTGLSGKLPGFGITGQYQGVLVSSTVKPQTSFGLSQTLGQTSGQYQGASGTVKPQASYGLFQSFGQPIKATTGQTGFQGFGQQSSGLTGQLSGLGQTGQYQGGSSTVKPQTSYGVSQSFGQPIKATTGQTGFQGFGQQSTGLTGQLSGFGQTGQYQGASSTVKPQTSYGLSQTLGQPIKVTTGQTGFQGFGQQSTGLTGQLSGLGQTGQYQGGSSTVKPQTSYGVSQSFGQPIKATTGQTGFQGFGQQSTGLTGQLSGLGQTGQYQGGSSTVKPQTSYGLSQSFGQPIKGTTGQSGFQGFGQQSTGLTGQLSGLGQTGQYQGGSSTVKPQTSYGLSQSFGQPIKATTGQTGFQGFGQQSTGLTGQLSGFGQTGQYQGGSGTVKPQTSYGLSQSFGQPIKATTGQTGFQGFGQQSTGLTGQLSGLGQTGQYQSATVSTSAKPVVTFGGSQSFGQTIVKPSASLSGPAIANSIFSQAGQYQGGQQKPISLSAPKPQTSFSGFQGFGQQSTGLTGQLSGLGQTGQYQSATVSTSAKPGVTFGGAQSFGQTIVKPSASLSGPAITSSIFSQAGQYQGGQQKPIALSAAKPQTSFGGFQGFGQSNLIKPSTSGLAQTGQYQLTGVKPSSQGFGQSTVQLTEVKPSTSPFGLSQSTFGTGLSSTVRPQASFGGFQGLSTAQVTGSKPSSFGTFGQVGGVKPSTASLGFGQATSGAQAGQFLGSQINVFSAGVKPTTTGLSQTSAKPSVGQYQGAQANVFLAGVKPTTAFTSGSQTGQYQKPLVSTSSKPLSSFGSFQGSTQTTYKKPQPSQSTSIYGQSIKPAVAIGGVSQSYLPPAKPQGFGQTSLQLTGAKPSTGQYQGAQSNVFLAGVKPSTAFSSISPVGQYQKPFVSVTAKPQSTFGTSQGFSQTTYQKPQVTQTTTTYGQTVKPVTTFGGVSQSYLAPGKPQGFGQSTLQLTGAKPSTGQYQGAQSNVFLSGVKPSTGFSSTSQVGQYQKPFVSKPQSTFGTSQGFSQTTYQKPQVTQTTSTYGQAAKPVTTFGGVSQSYLAPGKPQGFGQSTLQLTGAKPSAGQYQGAQSNVFLSGVKPSTGFSSTSQVGQYQKPFVSVTAKPQSTFGTSQGFSQTTYQKPQVTQTTSTYGQTAKPVTTFGGVSQSYLAPAKPQGFGQSTLQLTGAKPSTGQYQGAQSNVFLSGVKPSTGFSSTSQVGQYQKPFVSVTAKPQSTFGTSQGFSQTTYQKPQVIQTTSTYGQTAKPVTTFGGVSQSYLAPAKPQIQAPKVPAFNQYAQSTTAKPTVIQGSQPQLSYLPPKPISQPLFQGFSASSTTPKPAIAIVKPQNSFSGFQGFGQSTVQKPSVLTTTFSQYGQQAVKPSVVTGQYQSPVVSTTLKPQVSLLSTVSQYQSPIAKPQTIYQKPQVVQSTTTYGQTVKPAIAFGGLSQSYLPPGKPAAILQPKPVIQGFAQTTYQKPQVIQSTATYNQIAKPATTFGTLSQSYLTPAKPQAPALIIQKPAVQVSKAPALSPYGQQTVIQASKPQVSYLPPQAQLTVAKPQVAFQGFATSSSTPKPAVATIKPQASFSAFPGFGQSVAQKPAVVTTAFSQYGQQAVKPAVVTGKYQSPVLSTTVVPLTSFASTASPQYLQPTSRPTPAIKSPLIVNVQPQLASQNVNLEYLPPVGAKLPSNIAGASGAFSSLSDFDSSSATVNQVVDVAQGQKVGGFGLQAETNQLPIAAQEPKVGGIDIRTTASQDTTFDYPQYLAASQVPSLKSELTSATVDAAQGQKVGGFDETQLNSISQLNTNEITNALQGQSDAQTITLQGGYQAGNLALAGSFNYQGEQIGTQQFGGVQPQSHQAVPSQQVVQTQLRVLDNDQIIDEGTYLIRGDQYEAESQNDEYAEYRTLDDTPVEAPQETQNYEQYYQPAVNSEDTQLSSEPSEQSNRYEVVNSQIENDSQVQDPQPLNGEEQQVRQLEEKADPDKEEYAVKSLQPGSYVGPHVNKDSDKEYNVFDYDQYSVDPEETDT